MKKLIFIFIASLFFASCNMEPVLTDEQRLELRNKEADSLMASLRSPVILIGKKADGYGRTSITIKDGFGKIISLSNDLRISNNIGESRNVKDTIR